MYFKSKIELRKKKFVSSSGYTTLQCNIFSFMTSVIYEGKGENNTLSFLYSTLTQMAT